MKVSFSILSLGLLASASPILNTVTDVLLKTNKVGSPFTFTSTYSVTAKPNQVVDAMNKFTGGLKGAHGVFKYGINSHENVICYNITITGFQGEYQSLAKTSTHIHEGLAGKTGPPRIVFPDPVGPAGGVRTSIGCIKGPFTTGVKPDGKDTGEGFHVRQIEANPSGFFTDVHSSLAVPGAVRGQLSRKSC